MPAGPPGPPLGWPRRRCRAVPPWARPSFPKVLQQSALQDGHVLVASAGAADENSRAGVRLSVAPRAEKCMRTFDGGQYALELGAFGKRIQGFVVRRRLVGDSSALHQVRVLRAHPGVIEAGGHRMRFL